MIHKRLRQVGADRVVRPDFIGGLRMASEMIRPSVVGFLDTMLRSKEAAVRVEEIVVTGNSPLVGKTLVAAGLLDVEGVTVVALSESNGGYSFNPGRDRVLGINDVIIVMGIVERILSLKAQAAA